ncbi:MAG: hypothetical protein F6J94_21925 [Moorea sp. SIO1F2]|uniref:hypothetical protein n=1 Tax=unclassified Moorena TaxID=2683338 RepID=UPI0013B93782|nr:MULTISPECIES: hypothetical protein [unclassified Moorena]NEN94618.1 hypothetical protein [Moorena sp. SIO3I7]NEO08680.1 hypothetical protein [Moorena sp. SIO3I8]NET84478.1 hypothetical protein [Moorena sp. SIO1F2]
MSKKASMSQNINQRRTVHDFPNVIAVKRQDCLGGFFTPTLADITVKHKMLEDYFRSPTVGLLLPLGSKREQDTFSETLNYCLNWGIALERIVVIHSPRAQAVVDHLGLKEKGCVILNEAAMLDLFNLERIHSRFAVDLAKHKGKGRAFAIAFAYLKYVQQWQTLKDLFVLDVDINATQYRPLHYLGYAQAIFPDQERLFLLTAQNNTLRDNHYLFVMRDPWRHENELGCHYAKHFDRLVWSLTGETMLRWDMLVEHIPFAIAYGMETVWQLFAADWVALSQQGNYKVAQVVNPQTKRDGGSLGQSGRCYDATMYRQLSLMAWFLIKYGKPLYKFTPEDYHTVNTRLSLVNRTAILPDNEDHGLPYDVQLHSDLFIPPLGMLASEDCLNI